MSILQTTDLKKYYGAEPNITKALDGVTLSIEQGEFVAIVGTSGSGKSTLLNMMPAELDGDTVDKKFMDEVVRLLALGDKLNNMPNNLSGGQQQRVAIARALVSKPAIVLADEPTGNLDSRTSGDVLGLLKATSSKFHQTLVMITHNNEIAQLAHRIIRIEDGRIFE